MVKLPLRVPCWDDFCNTSMDTSPQPACNPHACNML